MSPSALNQLRAVGLELYVNEAGKLMLRGDINDEYLKLASRNKQQILTDLAEEEAHANYRARSRP
jgi:hypothetical protein